MTDEELIAQLRKFGELWPDDHAAADRIEALVREKAAAYAQGYGDCEAEISLTEIGRTNEFLHGQIAKWKARAKRLDLAVDYILDGMGIHYPDYEIDAEDDFLDAANSKWVRDTLTRLAEAMRGNDDTK